MSHQLVTLVTAFVFVLVLGSSSLFSVRHEVSARRTARRSARRAARRRASARVASSTVVHRDHRPVAARV